jgi:regulator of replication initiation timing
MKFRVLLTTALLFTAVPVLPAQQTTQTERDLRAKIEQLRRENTALHTKIEKLRARRGQAEEPVARDVARQDPKKRLADEARKKRAASAEAAQVEAGLKRIRVALRRARLARNLQGGAVATLVINPLHKGEYQKALTELRQVQRRLQSIIDVDAAMKAVDEANQVLLRARAALWKQKQAAKSEK